MMRPERESHPRIDVLQTPVFLLHHPAGRGNCISSQPSRQSPIELDSMGHNFRRGTLDRGQLVQVIYFVLAFTVTFLGLAAAAFGIVIFKTPCSTSACALSQDPPERAQV